MLQCRKGFSDMVKFFIQFTATAQLTAPGGNLCLGDTLTYECITLGTGQLVWQINDVRAGAFNIQDAVGTSSQTIPGVTVILMARQEAGMALSSNLIIQSAGVDVKVGDIISCTETPGTIIESRELSLLCKLIDTYLPYD